MYFNLKLGQFAEDRLLVFFNRQCCGIAMDYRNTRQGQGRNSTPSEATAR